MAGILAVATWNLENLFRPRANAAPERQAAYQAKLTSLADTIATLAPDVLAVQEVGTPAALEDLGQHVGGQWHIEASKHPDDRHIRVAVLSRLPLHDVEQVRDFPPQLRPVQVDDQGATIAQMPRGALRVRVTFEGTPVDVVTCHLKSKLLSFPHGFAPDDEGQRARFGSYALDRRAAEATTIREYANTLLGGHGDERCLLVLGDFNDEPHAATTEILLGPPGSQLGTGGEHQADAGDGWRLWNLAPRIPEKRRFTRIFEGRHELIDHILVSKTLLDGAQDVNTGADALPSITEDPTARQGQLGSDHAPIIARIRFN